MGKLQQALHLYQAHHTHLINKCLHIVGVPAIIMSLLIGSCAIHLIFTTWVVIALLTFYYLSLDLFLGSITALFLCLLNVIITAKPLLFSYEHGFILFIGGWIFQFLGHWIEGKRPAFFQSIGQIFIAPLFIIAEISHFFRKSS